MRPVGLLLLITLFLAVSSTIAYIKALCSSGEVKGPGLVSFSLGPLEKSTGSSFIIQGFVLLAQGDNVSFIVKTPGCKHRLRITVIDVIHGKRFEYAERVPYTFSPIPVFATPSTSIYAILVNVSMLECKGSPVLSFRSIASFSHRAPRLGPLVLGGVIVSCLLAAFLLRAYLERSRFLWLVSSYVSVAHVWLLGLVLTAASAAYVAEFKPFFGVRPEVLLALLSLSLHDHFIPVFAVIVSLVSMVLFAYTHESGYEKLLDMQPVSRPSKFLAKLLAVLYLTWLPLNVTYVASTLILIPEAYIHAPWLTLTSLISYAVYTLLSTLLPASITILISSLARRTVAALSAPALIIILSLIAPRQIKLDEIIAGGDPVNIVAWRPLRLISSALISATQNGLQLLIPGDYVVHILSFTVPLLLASLAVCLWREEA